MVDMNARGVELIAQVRTSRTGPYRVIGPEPDVVGEEPRTSVEELRECLLPVLGVEHVLLVHGNPRKLTSLLRDPLVETGVLSLELRKLIASSLPLLAAANLLIGHSVTSFSVSPDRRG